MVSPNSLKYPPCFLGEVPNRSPSDGKINGMSYLPSIISSHVYGVAVVSPLQLSPKLSERLKVNLWLKREDFQPTFSFKIRGAYNMMAKLPKELLEKAFMCSSTGNHAQGVALAAKKLNCNAVVAVAFNTPDIKRKSGESPGATVVLTGNSYEEALAYAKNRAKEEGRTFVSGFDHPDVIAGQGTIGIEIVSQAQGPLHAIFALVGGGGLVAGIATH